MLFSSITKTARSRLGVKSILAVVLLITTISAILTSFFISRQKRLLTNELRTRVRSVAQNLAYDARNYIITGNTDKLFPLAQGVMQEKDIKRALIIDYEGTIIDHTDYGHIGKEFIFPADRDSLTDETWFPTEADNMERMIVPIEIKRKAVHGDSGILYSMCGNSDSQESTLYLYEYFCFPCFSHDSREVTFSSIKNDHSYRVIMSMNIDDFSYHVLVEGGSHGQWSHDGQFLTFSTKKEIAVCTIATNELRILCKKGIGRIGYPCFTHDDAYIITTLQTDPPDIFSEKLFRIPLEGGEPEQLTYHDGQHHYPSCSPDGKWILYTDILNMALYLYNTESGKSSRLFPDLLKNHNCGSFSSDGSKVSYLLATEGNYEVLITEFPVEKKKLSQEIIYGKQLTSNGGWKWMLDWSPDGKWITYKQGTDICIISTGGGNPINLTESLLNREIIGYIVLDVSLERLNMSIAESIRIALIFTGIIIGLGALGTVLMVRKLVRPVQNLADATKKVVRGNFDQTVSVTRSDEIGILEESFNTMTDYLKKYREETEAWNRDLENKVSERSAELVEKHNELEKAYKELETLDKTKDDFLSLVSHELRTPLSSILVFSEMLYDGVIESEEKIKHIHATIIKNCNRLSRLINDVLDISKIEAGRMTFKREVLNIKELVEETVGGFQSLIENRKITADYSNIPQELFVLGDRDRVIQVLINIISNAVKFNSENGTITISSTSNNTMGTVSVHDTGKGIKKEDIQKVFDRFHQLENIDHHVEGTGLGMSISKSVIERQGGKIWIESESGKGTTVFLSLPLAGSRDETKLPTREESYSETKSNEKITIARNHLKILIADDDEEIRMALKECVKSEGFEPFEAADGNETLRMVELHQPDLLILDVMMPDLSGLDVCRKLRENPNNSDIKILMLSARGQEKEKEEGLHAGADRYVAKPFNYKELIKAIEELLD